MAPSEFLGKRPAFSRAASHVSAQTAVLPKRPRKQCHEASPASSQQFKDLQQAWSAFESDVDAALLELRTPALNDIASALARTPKGGQVPAVCVNMGAAAAAGDRADVFHSILEHLRFCGAATVLCFQSGHHSSMSAVTQQFRSVAEDQDIVVAVEDADLFPEDTLRDLVYLCGKRQQAVAENSRLSKGVAPSVAILFGLGTSADSLHSALGIQEATVILPTNIDMPHATACFKVIVEKVLSLRSHPALLSQTVYDLIETEFFAKESTVAVVMRALHQIYTIHFYRQPLAAPFSKRKELNAQGPDVELSEDSLNHLRNNVVSVERELSDRHYGDGELCTMATKWHSLLCTWQTQCRVVEQVVYEVIRVLQAPERGWTKEKPNHSDLRLHVFRAFLVTEDSDRAVDVRNIARIISNKIEKSNRQQLLVIITTMKEAMKSCGVVDDEEIHDSLERLSDLTEALEATDRENKHDNKEQEEENILAGSLSTRRFAKGGAAARQRRAEMLRNSRQAERISSVLSGPRRTLMAIVSDLLRLVEPLGMLPMHEVILFSDAKALQDMSGGLGSTAEPRTSFFRAMRDPSKMVGFLSDSLIPDTAIAYRLLAESGRMKNLYDWYHTFSTMRTAGAVERDTDGNITGLKDVSQAETQVRFSRVCAELEFLGLIKHTNRKTDHVLRLTFE